MDMQRAPPTGEEGVGNMEGNGGNSSGGAVAKRLWHIVRVVYYMIRKLMMELHLLFKRGKIAGKAIGNLMFHHHVDDPHRPDHHYSSSGGGGYYAAFTCRSMDPNLSYYNPREVEFSCSNTPSYPFDLNKRKGHHHHHRYSNNYGYDYDVATVRKALEIINSQLQAGVPRRDGHPVAGSSFLGLYSRPREEPHGVRPAAQDHRLDFPHRGGGRGRRPGRQQGRGVHQALPRAAADAEDTHHRAPRVPQHGCLWLADDDDGYPLRGQAIMVIDRRRR